MKLPFWGTILTLVGLMVLCGFGLWQLERLEWKEQLLAGLQQEYAKDAAQTPLQVHQPVMLERGYITGRYHHDKAIRITPRTHDGTPGYHVLTPLQQAEGGIVIVNRGWIPIDHEMPADAIVHKPEGEVKVTGMLRSPPEVNMFVPDNQPEENVWYQIDIAEISAAKGLEGVAPNILYAEDEYKNGEHISAPYPVSAATRLHINNNHAQYALFWFAMAAAMLAVYTIRFIIPLIRQAKR